MSINIGIIKNLVPPKVIVQRLDGKIGLQIIAILMLKKTVFLNIIMLLPETLEHKRFKVWQ